MYFYIPFISLEIFNILQYVPNSNRFGIVSHDRLHYYYRQHYVPSPLVIECVVSTTNGITLINHLPFAPRTIRQWLSIFFILSLFSSYLLILVWIFVLGSELSLNAIAIILSLLLKSL